jgi:hypothetical protein
MNCNSNDHISCIYPYIYFNTLADNCMRGEDQNNRLLFLLVFLQNDKERDKCIYDTWIDHIFFPFAFEIS